MSTPHTDSPEDRDDVLPPEDTEGHRARVAPIDSDEEDTEGHLRAR